MSRIQIWFCSVVVLEMRVCVSVTETWQRENTEPYSLLLFIIVIKFLNFKILQE
jgi:hypothetical protein